MWVLILQRLALDFFFHLLYFPLWWYTGGLRVAASYSLGLLRMGNEYLAPGLWLRNLFVPMFGQNDWQGRLVSILMRAVNVVVRAIGLTIWSVFTLLIFLVWPLAPLLIGFMLMQVIT